VSLVAEAEAAVAPLGEIRLLPEDAAAAMSELSPEEIRELDEGIDRSPGVVQVRLPKPAQPKPERIELPGGRKPLKK
jgi:hypothetical protein